LTLNVKIPAAKERVTKVVYKRPVVIAINNQSLRYLSTLKPIPPPVASLWR